MTIINQFYQINNCNLIYSRVEYIWKMKRMKKQIGSFSNSPFFAIQYLTNYDTNWKELCWSWVSSEGRSSSWCNLTFVRFCLSTWLFLSFQFNSSLYISYRVWLLLKSWWIGILSGNQVLYIYQLIHRLLTSILLFYNHSI